MNRPDANIEIITNPDKSVFISVSMPIWSKESEIDGNILVKLPLLGLETIAKDENDSEAAIKELIQAFCIAAEKFGAGIEKELQSLGWKRVDQDGKHIIGYCVSETDALIDRLLQTGDNYVNNHLEITEEAEHA